MPLTDRTTYTLNVCTDCAEYLANGWVSDVEGADNDTTEVVSRAITERWGDATIVPGEWGNGVALGRGLILDEPLFSWFACSGCGSDLGGDRYPATAFVQDITEGQ